MSTVSLFHANRHQAFQISSMTVENPTISIDIKHAQVIIEVLQLCLSKIYCLTYLVHQNVPFGINSLFL